jgi:hypothetical protein
MMGEIVDLIIYQKQALDNGHMSCSTGDIFPIIPFLGESIGKITTHLSRWDYGRL